MASLIGEVASTTYNTSNSGLPSNYVWTIAIDASNNKWIGTDSGLARFNGTSWTIYRTSNSGLPDNKVYSIRIDGTENKWIGTFGRGVAVYRAGGIVISAVREENADLPMRLKLMQNHPNPFNPTTLIQYDLPKPSHATLVIYSMLGQFVDRLVDERQNEGTHKVKWDASGVPSGIYFYRLQAGEFVETKKMVLLH